MSRKNYTFTRPVFALFLLPVLVLLAFLVMGLIREFSVLVLILALINVLVLYGFAGLGFLRRVSLDGSGIVWRSPRRSLNMEWEEVKHIGKVRFRSFTFIYLSKSEEDPFVDPAHPVVTDEDTFLFQYRKSAFQSIRERLPHLLPREFSRG